uniref:Putative secreted protein n=1 Tax=Ixodes ricinus TaxID=34613 RepID=A0A6B0UEY8_IXORI
MILRQPFFLALSFLTVLSSPMRAISHSCLRERNVGFFSQNVEDTVLYSTAVVQGRKEPKKGIVRKAAASVATGWVWDSVVGAFRVEAIIPHDLRRYAASI